MVDACWGSISIEHRRLPECGLTLIVKIERHRLIVISVVNVVAASTGTENEAKDDGQLIPGLGMDIKVEHNSFRNFDTHSLIIESRQDSNATTRSSVVQQSSVTYDIGIMDSSPQVTVSIGPGPVTIDGNITIVFHHVKFKGTAAGSAGNQPVNRLGHLHKVAFDHASLDLVFTIARGNQPKISIVATTNGEAFVTVTFIMPTYVQSMEFEKRVANEPGVLAIGSEPMNELTALKDTETGVIPGHLRKVSLV